VFPRVTRTSIDWTGDVHRIDTRVYHCRPVEATADPAQSTPSDAPLGSGPW